MTEPARWEVAAREELLNSRAGGCGWAYRHGSPPATEPSALAALALLAGTEGRPPEPDARRATREAASWLAECQGPDGSVGLSASQPTPGWVTPYALLLWDALGGWPDARARAAGWLLRQRGTTTDPALDPGHVTGHDTTLVGWPWVAGTHSWLEPTALSLLALDREASPSARDRRGAGLALIRDRALPSGGWNYGNKAVFGKALRAQPGPTGLALLALAGTGPGDAAVLTGLSYLRGALPATRAPASLGWGLLGLLAWGESPPGASGWLAESYEGVTGRPDAAPKLACLLLAAGSALPLFHRETPRGDTRER